MPASAITILHVEDDPNDVVLFEHACRKAGLSFRLENVTDGDQAIAYFRGAESFANRRVHPLPQLVLLDLKMPHVNGFDVLAWLRGEKDFQRTPVIVLTSSSHEADIRKAYEMGANSYLVKPVGFDALVELVRGIHGYWLSWNEGSRMTRVRNARLPNTDA